MRKAKQARPQKVTALVKRKPSLDPLDVWATRITAAMNKTIDGIFAVGRELTQARADLEKKGAWTRLFDEGRIQMTIRTAERFMEVWKARDRLVPKTTHGSFLPPSWRTLYELQRLPEDTLAWAHEHEKIRPDMERKDVAAIKREFKGDEVTGEEKPWELMDARERIYRWLARDRERWPESLRGDYCEVLGNLIVRLRDEAISH